MDYSTVILTVLSFSGGAQSTCLLWMILHGLIKITGPFIVLNADPGMENSTSYAIVDALESECQKAGIPFIRVKRNLYQEILDLKRDIANGVKTRFDNPPYWTKNRITGKRGRLKQCCTKAYKIAPMDRAVRVWLEEKYGISRDSKRLGKNIVRKLIGFSADEVHRINEDDTGVEYSFFDYPLVELGFDKTKVVSYLKENNHPVPQRSVCNACFANGTKELKIMHDERPKDWEQAVKIDDEIRDLTCIGVEDECFVSWTLLPLRELSKDFNVGFRLEEESRKKKSASLDSIDSGCQTGFCFV